MQDEIKFHFILKKYFSAKANVFWFIFLSE